MNDLSKISVVLPSLDPDEKLIAVVDGLLEYGSPVLPKTPEALILHHADNVDAKMEMFRATYEGATMLSDHVVQRKSPMQTNVVLPLPTVQS